MMVRVNNAPQIAITIAGQRLGATAQQSDRMQHACTSRHASSFPRWPLDNPEFEWFERFTYIVLAANRRA